MNLTNEEPDTSPGGTNWFESADSKKIGAVSYVHAQWNIPSAPKSRRGQRVYFFPGLVNSKLQATTILQPVLGWNQADSNIEGWSLASWNCCKKGKVHHSKFIPAPGSMVSGDIIGLDCNNGVCSKWRIVSYDWASHRSTILNTTAFGLKMNWIFGGVLEAPGVRKCNQLPPDPVTFSDFIINDSDGRHVSTPSWNKTFWRHRPDCDFHISSSGDRVTLHY
jgi:hypothetical protein